MRGKDLAKLLGRSPEQGESKNTNIGAWCEQRLKIRLESRSMESNLKKAMLHLPKRLFRPNLQLILSF